MEERWSETGEFKKMYCPVNGPRGEGCGRTRRFQLKGNRWVCPVCGRRLDRRKP